MQAKIYHNPRCSKSRQALKLLEDSGTNFELIQYLKTPPTHQELSNILRALNFKPRDLMRKNESCYKTENLNDDNLTDEELIEKMIEFPILIERPIVIVGDKTIVARPPERVLEII